MIAGKNKRFIDYRFKKINMFGVFLVGAKIVYNIDILCRHIALVKQVIDAYPYAIGEVGEAGSWAQFEEGIAVILG